MTIFVTCYQPVPMNYQRLGDHIREVNIRNRELRVNNLQGVSISKAFMPSIANTIGTDMSTYKIVERGQFAYGPVTSRNGDKVSIALLDDCDTAIISQAYTVFEVIDTNKLLPEYLMMWFRRPEFDRYARFHSHGSAREVFDWEEMCDVQLPVPPIERQREIVAEYETLTRRIRLNEQIIQRLEATAQALYRNTFVDNIDKQNLPPGWHLAPLGEVCSKIGSGATPKGGKGSYADSGISLIRSMNVFDLKFVKEELAHITSDQAKQLDNVCVQKNDILLNITGASVARCCMVPESVLPARVNQHVMIIRPSKEQMAFYLLCLLCANESKQILLSTSQSGSTREAITKSEIESFPILIPNEKTLFEFDEQAKMIFSNIDNYTIEIEKLTELQSLLLAKMGQI